MLESSRLSDEQISTRLTEISGWDRRGELLARLIVFAGFREALDFVNRVGELAEGLDHHPNFRLYDWNKVELELTTHSESGLTAKDFELAEGINAILSAHNLL
ncbi:MAG: 4a-hydroxytetrahydrobiopterin dehydratase [Acidobacteria bacterium]|nr:4a-hydroxytetrahydrobiopterin dehydratase [Acidobacteriota bacterium]